MLLQLVAGTIARHSMLAPGQTVLVAVSGGPDSLALLDVLSQLAGEQGVRLAVAHLDHGFRSDSAADAVFVAAQTAERGLQYYGERVDVPSLIAGSGQSPEAVAREVRYAFYERAAAALGAERVALGHNADDQAETVIMRLLRGAGSEGLAAIPPVRLPYIRPLIETSRQAIEEYCSARGLKPRQDSTNTDPAYLRNRIRHSLMPELRQFNPRLSEALAAVAERARAEADYIRAQAEIHLSLLTGQAGPAAAGVAEPAGIDCGALAQLPVALQRAVLRLFYERETDAQPPAYHHIERLRALALSGRPGGAHQLPGDTIARFEYGRLLITLPDTGAAPFALSPKVPGLTALPGGEALAAWLTKPEHFDWPNVNFRRQAFLDRAACGEGLVVRNRRPGDRIRPLGMGGMKKLQDVLVDAKVPRRLRDRLPLLATDDDAGEILWVPGLVVSERARVTPATEVALGLQLLSEPVSRCYACTDMLE